MYDTERLMSAPQSSPGTGPVLLYNSLARQVQPFVPRHPGRAHVYTCGPTVYNDAHVGNLRTYVFADTLRRVLQWKKFDVLHVINITDVGHLTSDADAGDDKVEVAARRASVSAFEITRRHTRTFMADLESLNVRPAATYCHATRHIQEMIEFVRTLERRGLTYRLADGVYFDTSKVSDYGRLAGLDAEAQLAGARIAADPDKRNPTDFSVWRLSPPDSTRQMEWESPWGKGFPGWHLECSVMSLKYLGGPFDIHTGGVDHRQLHHPNEIAQNQGYLGDSETGATYWLHAEFLIMRDAKMSKSSGDFWRLRTLVDAGVHPLVYRFFLLHAHYRAQVDFTSAAVAGSRVGYERILRRVGHLLAAAGKEGDRLRRLTEEAGSTTGGSLGYLRSAFEDDLSPDARRYVQDFDRAVSDDLSTPRALALLSSLIADRGLSPLDVLRVVATMDLVLGLELLTREPRSLMIRPAGAALSDEEIDRLVEQRTTARAARDFEEADRVRACLTEAGVVLEDSTDGTSWAWQVG